MTSDGVEVTLETDPDDNGTWTTEYAGTFDHPSGHATVFCEHDDAGNLTFDGVYRYGYDAWNRLVEVRNAYREQTGSQNVREGSVVTAMAYDGLGRRIVKTVSNSGDLNATLHSLYDAQREIEERNGADLVLRQQVWGLDYIDELVVVSTNLNPQSGSSSQDPDPQQCDVDHYAVLDAQFNVLGLIGVELEQAVALVNDGSFSGSPYQTVRQTTAQNPQGNWPIVVVERYEYTPYGQRQVYRGSDNGRKAYAPYLASARLGPSGHSLNPFGHQGLKHDEGIGLVYNRARMLHPGLGRFVQRDRLAYVDGMAVYTYLRSAPLAYVDWNGLQTGFLGGQSRAGMRRQRVPRSRSIPHLSQFPRDGTGDGRDPDRITQADDFGGGCNFVIFVNGIDNTNEFAEESFDALVAQVGIERAQAARVQNGTHGVDLAPGGFNVRSGDLRQLRREALGLRTIASQRVEAQIRQMEEAARLNGCCCYAIHLFAHSQGTATANNALYRLSPESRARISYRGSGGQIQVMSDLGLGAVENLVNHEDFVANNLSFGRFVSDEDGARFPGRQIVDRHEVWPDGYLLAGVRNNQHSFIPNYLDEYNPGTIANDCP